MTSWPTTSYPFERVHIDFFYFNSNQIFLYVDSYSKWIDAFVIKQGNALGVIDGLRQIFATVGLPTEICSDNGPPFHSHEFENFCTSYGIKVSKSPPYHPQSNGLAERAVQTVKNSLKKFSIDPKTRDWKVQRMLSIFLFRYRNTPTTTTKLAQSSIIFSYKPKIEIDKLLIPIKEINDNAKQNLENKNKKKYINCKNYKNCNKLLDFKEGEKVWYMNVLQNDANWIEAYIIKKLSKTIYSISIRGSVRNAHVGQMKQNTSPVIKFGVFDSFINPNTSHKRCRSNSVEDIGLRRSERILKKQRYLSNK